MEDHARIYWSSKHSVLHDMILRAIPPNEDNDRPLCAPGGFHRLSVVEVVLPFATRATSTAMAMRQQLLVLSTRPGPAQVDRWCVCRQCQWLCSIPPA